MWVKKRIEYKTNSITKYSITFNSIIMKKVFLMKMKTELAEPIKYFVGDGENMVLMNDFLGKTLKISFSGEINCIKCGAKIKKTFGQGFCYPCFASAPEVDTCIVNPEKCQAHEGISRDMEWAKNNCLKPHYVYFSKTSNIKVGVTRETQIPTRWIDQGASQAIKFAKTPYRQLAGAIEVEMKQHFADKTAWQKMLKNISTDDDLLEAKNRAIGLLSDDLKKFIVKDNTIWNLEFPTTQTPKKVKSIKLDKVPQIEGVLTGIKGQYLIFDNEFVFNVRSHSGYNVEIQ